MQWLNLKRIGYANSVGFEFVIDKRKVFDSCSYLEEALGLVCFHCSWSFSLLLFKWTAKYLLFCKMSIVKLTIRSVK